MNSHNGFLNLINQIKCSFLHMKFIGIDAVDCSETSINLLDEWSFAESISRSNIDNLTSIRNNISDCTKCRLCKQRTNIVFGEGSESARLIFIGEGPGSEEDNTGRPFVGKAGKLLTRIIEAMGFTRDEVYICNIVKCRPPGNRNPKDDEIRQCMPFLRRQILAISPKVICLLGAVACRGFLNIKTPISKLRGTFISLPGVEDIMIMPTFHPAYLLRNSKKKKEVWEDVQKIMKILK